MSLTHSIRFQCKKVFESKIDTPGHPPIPYLQSFLVVPLQERLTLLSLYDGQSMEEIKAALPWVKETDVRLSSRRILAAAETLRASVDNPTSWMNPGPIPATEAADLIEPTTPLPIRNRDIPDNIDKQLRQALFYCVPVVLFGAYVPLDVYNLGLRRRVIVYLAVVEEMTWGEIMALMNCSKHQIHHSLTSMIEALGGK